MYVTYSAAGAASSKPLPTGAASSAPFLMGVALPAGAALLVPTQPCTMPFSVVDDANTKPPLPPSPVQMQMQFPWSMHTQLRRPATLPCHMPLKPIVKPPTPREKPPQPSHLAMTFQTATLQQRLRRWRDSSPGHAVPAGGFRDSVLNLHAQAVSVQNIFLWSSCSLTSTLPSTFDVRTLAPQYKQKLTRVEK
jgi:hypothetical protein